MRHCVRAGVALVSVAALTGLGVAGSVPASADTTVNNYSDLQADFTQGGTVTLEANLTAPNGQALSVGGTPVTLDLNGFTLTIANAPDNTPAILVTTGQSFTVEDTSSGKQGTLQVTGDDGGAGIGGTDANGGGSSTINGGTVTVNSGTVIATGGGGGGAGIGGSGGSGDSGAGGSVTVNGGTVTATGGATGAGIGGGGGNSNGVSGGSVTVNGGTVTATGGVGGAGIGGGYLGAGASVVIGVGGVVTAVGGSNAPAVGGGYSASSVAEGFGSLSNAGMLTIPSGAMLTVPSGVTVDNSGVLSLGGTLYGLGTVDNTGSFAVSGSSALVSGDGQGPAGTHLYVAPNNYGLSFDTQGASSATPSTELVFADTVAASGQSLPAAPTRGSDTFVGWFTAPNGGTLVTDTSSLSTPFGPGPKSETLYAQYAPARTQPLAFTSSPPSPAAPGASYDAAVSGGNGSGNPVTVSVDPATTGYSTAGQACTVDAATPPPGSQAVIDLDHAGSCVLDANQAAGGGYQAATQVQQTFTITQAGQMITFTAPMTATGTAGSAATVTASGGGSGNPVQLSVDASSAGVCTLPANSVSGASVSYLAAGTCTIDATQAGSSGYTPGSGSLSITVSQATSSVSLSLDPLSDSAVYGQPVTATAAASTAGTVQFSVNGTPVGSPIATGTNDQAVSGPLTNADGSTLSVGSTQIGAFFTPSDAVTYAGSQATPVMLVVNPDSTTTTLAVAQHTASGKVTLSASVAPDAPGAGTPTGQVAFEVNGSTIGSAALDNGTATLSTRLPAGRADTIGATYAGDTNDAISTATTTLHGTAPTNPPITAHEHSAHPETRYGWYRSPVTVTFTCHTHGSPLTGRCPAPVTLAHNGAGQTVSRQITAANGGAATVTVHVNLDRTAPAVAITGLHHGQRYLATDPDPRCHAADTLSGVASCTLTHTTHHTTSGQTITYTATATDRAGNTATTHTTATIAYYALSGAPYRRGPRRQGHGRNGAYLVHTGHDYTLLAVTTGTRPDYIDATPYPGHPAGHDYFFHRAGTLNGHPRWALTITIPHRLHTHRYWNIGIRTGHTTHTLTINVHH